MKGLLVFCMLICVFQPVAIPADEPTNPLAIQGNVRASFQVKPLVQVLAGRRGQRIPFRFEVQTVDRPQALRIRAVSLKQQLNGLVVVDADGPPPADVTLAGAVELNVTPLKSGTIEGFVNVPRSQSPFHVYGILVTDLGQHLKGVSPQKTPNQIGVRFVTQYLLRLEVRVTNGRQANAKDLRFESVRLVERNGWPYVVSDVVNPTEAGVEFQVSCRLLDNLGKEIVPKFGVGLPVRASREGPARYASMVLGHNRVRLAAPVPQAVFPGQYQLELKWISQRRVGGEVSFPVAVREGDFPAQAAATVQVAQALNVTPAQVELSLARRGNRRQPLTLTNHHSQPLQVKLTAHNLDGTPANWALLQPDTFLLQPGRRRNVLVAASAGDDIENHRYGYLRATIGSGHSHDLPLALLGRSETQPDLHVGSLGWDPKGERPAFVVPITNQGSVHVPLNGRLEITNDLGQSVEILGGFDRWIFPGERDEIRFPLHRLLPPANYKVQVQIQMVEGQDPVTIKQQVVIQAQNANKKAGSLSDSSPVGKSLLK